MVVAVGNPLRGDDGVGLAVAARLRGRVPAGVTVLECVRDPSALLELWGGARAALVVDAVDSGAEPGALHRYDASVEPLPARVFRASTHSFGLGEWIEVGRALGRLPATVIVYGVEGRDFTLSHRLGDAVAAAVDGAAGAILADLGRVAHPPPA